MRKEARHWDRLAPIYDGLVEREYGKAYTRFRKIFFKYVKRKQKVLDVATGTGDIAVVLYKRSKDVTGLDISEGMLVRARERGGSNPTFVAGDAHSMDFKRGTFDLVTCCNGLNVMRAPRAALEDMRRVLRNGGRLVTITFCYGDAPFGHRLHLLGQAIRIGRPPHWHSFEGKALRALHTEVGLKVLKAEYCWTEPPAVVMVVRK